MGVYVHLKKKSHLAHSELELAHFLNSQRWYQYLWPAKEKNKVVFELTLDLIIKQDHAVIIWYFKNYRDYF